jgi:hypothetical protein
VLALFSLFLGLPFDSGSLVVSSIGTVLPDLPPIFLLTFFFFTFPCVSLLAIFIDVISLCVKA